MSDDTRQEQHGDGQDASTASGRSTVEWITLGISGAVLLAILGTITWLSFRGPETPPVITVEPNMEQLRRDESGFYLPVVISNTGDTTVADAIVQAELDTGSGQPETAEVTVDFLDGSETVAATFVFREDPASGELTTGVTSYKEP